MSGNGEDEYELLRELKSSRGPALRRRHGAHALGIGPKRIKGGKTDRLALIFYVAQKSTPAEKGPEPVPPSVTFTPTGAATPVTVLTDVVETPPAELQ